MPPSRLSLRRTASCRTSWLLHCLSSSSCCAAHLVISSHQLVVASPLLVLSLCRPPVILSHQLVLASPLAVLSLRRPLVLSSCRLVVASPLDAPPTCPLVVPPSHPLSMPADCHIAFCHPLVAPPSRPLIVPAGCCVVFSCVTHLSSHCAGWLLSYLSLRHISSSRCAALPLRRLVVALPPSNTAAAIKCHRTPPPLPLLPPPPLPLPLLTAIFATTPLSIAKERGSSSTTTSVPTAAPT
jgi:hypothetical protein